MANSDVAFHHPSSVDSGRVRLPMVPTRFRATVSACIGFLLSCSLRPRGALHPLGSVVSIAYSSLCSPNGGGGSVHAGVRTPRMVATTGAAAAEPPTPCFSCSPSACVMPSKAPNGDGSEASRVGLLGLHGKCEQVCYACCFVGLFTGPFFTHAAWDDAMRRPRPMPTRRALADGLLAAVGALIVWRGVATLLPYHHVAEMATAAGTSETFVSASFARRVLYFYASSFQFRWRFYVCWLLMDLAGRVMGFEPAAIANVESPTASWPPPRRPSRVGTCPCSHGSRATSTGSCLNAPPAPSAWSPHLRSQRFGTACTPATTSSSSACSRWWASSTSVWRPMARGGRNLPLAGRRRGYGRGARRAFCGRTAASHSTAAHSPAATGVRLLRCGAP